MQLQYEKLLARPPCTVAHTYTERDTILYALAVGAGWSLHIDPAVAQAAGFDRPILHGGVTVIDNGRFDFI